MPESLLQKVYRVFDPAPLTADQRDLYVPLDAVRGNAGVVNRLANKIRLLDKPTCQLLAGHRGSGKSTELRRLQAELESGENKIFTVYCEVDRDADLNDVDYLEVLIAIVRQMAQQLKERLGISLRPGYFKDRFERLKKLFGNAVSFDEFEIATGLLTLSGSIKNSPEARTEFRKLLEPDTGNWILAANDLIGEAKLELVKKGYENLAIIIDDLDKMVLKGFDSPENPDKCCIFVLREAQLTALGCHLVYTMPIALAYSSQERVIAGLYGGNIPVVPMIKIASPPPENTPFKPGLDKMRELIDVRLAKIGVRENDVFKNTGIRDLLIRLSGGQPRELMLMIRESIAGGGLPIPKEAVERTRKEGRRAYARQLRLEHWSIVDSVRKTGCFLRDNDNDGPVRELLDSRAILQYANDATDDWYNVNPLIADMKSPEIPPAEVPS